MNVVELRYTSKGWEDHHVPHDMHVLIIEPSGTTWIGRIDRANVIVTAGVTYRIVWDESWGLTDLINHKKDIERHHGISEGSYVHRRRRRKPATDGEYSASG